MKFVRVLLPVLVVFFPLVLSQKVEPSFVSSFTIGKANDNVSPIVSMSYLLSFFISNLTPP